MPTQPPLDLKFPIEAIDHQQGPESAPITLVEYGDYECPYCGRAFPILKKLREELHDQLRLVFRHFPQNSVHKHASVAAQAAEAAAAQQKFWPMHELLFGNQDALEGVDFDRYALKIGLEIYKFQADMSSERFVRRIDRDRESGVASGVKKTPTLFINGMKYGGELEYEELLAAVNGAR